MVVGERDSSDIGCEESKRSVSGAESRDAVVAGDDQVSVVGTNTSC